MLKFEVAWPAQLEMASILGESEMLHGPRARLRYQTLIECAILDLAKSPTRIGANPHPLLPAEYRLYHLSHSRRRGRKILVKNPRHFLLFRVRNKEVLEIVAFLYDNVNLDARLREQDFE